MFVESETGSFRNSETQNNLPRILESCSNLAEAGDFHESENTAFSELVKFLDSLLDAAVSDRGSENAENDAFEATSEIHRYICSPSTDQLVCTLDVDFCKTIKAFLECKEQDVVLWNSTIASAYGFHGQGQEAIKLFNEMEQENLLESETLGYSSKITKAASYIVPPLSGLSKVFISIQRRQFEQVKVAVPIILDVLKAVPLESEEAELEGWFGGHVLEEVAQTAKENLIVIKYELRNNQTKRWQAIGKLKHVLSFVKLLPWELKKHAINFLLCITEEGVSRNYNKEHSEWSSYVPSLFSALQAVKMVFVYAPEPEQILKDLTF